MKTMTTEECIDYVKQQPIEKQNAIVMILQELEKAEVKHPQWPTAPNKLNERKDYIVAAAILAEESGELIRASLQFAYEAQFNEDEFYNDMLKEATQTAAMGIRFLING